METLLGLDYNVWWFLVFGAVISGYAILDGFDPGSGCSAFTVKKRNQQAHCIKCNWTCMGW